ncbi:hypothetical protein ISN45_Aa02g010940 [Arabidopsis thaliana x Arabidopsis arenosa]|uniref:Uncharacterized protein n=1 Tax=Arabidopsis thaliana x Arabidopsis arenosa TaxID=1240361 RepID=A0A8T2BIB5_9BRAS|nr:hypothetical protein ISN45_Aa02g010940 [Arabidopsis thaliana x Arabidopsis arenosa]
MGKPSKADTKFLTLFFIFKKFDKKLQFYTKVKDTITSLSVQKEIGKKSALPAPELKMNCKRRQKLVLTEGERLNKVLDHPAFQADPIGSIFQHLQSQQPPEEENPKKKTNTNGSKKRNKKK